MGLGKNNIVIKIHNLLSKKLGNFFKVELSLSFFQERCIQHLGKMNIWV